MERENKLNLFKRIEQVVLVTVNEVVDGGSKLSGHYRRDVEKINWIVFDVTSEKLTRHSASIP